MNPAEKNPWERLNKISEEYARKHRDSLRHPRHGQPKMWKKVPMMIHIQEDDSTVPSGKRRLSYDVAYTEDYELVGCLRRWANEVNNRFPNIKLWITGPMMECVSDTTEDDKISVDIEETNKPLIDAFNENND